MLGASDFSTITTEKTVDDGTFCHDEADVTMVYFALDLVWSECSPHT